MKNNNLKIDDSYKAWGLFTIIMNIVSVSYYCITQNNNILLDLQYYLLNQDMLNIIIVLSPFILLLFAIIEGIICIIANKNKSYMLLAFIFIVIDNLIYIITNILFFDLNNIGTLTIWLIFRFYILYLTFIILKKYLENKDVNYGI